MFNQNLLFKLMSSHSKAYQELKGNEIFLSLIEQINQNSVVLDIGANVGNISNFLLEKKGPKIFAFEPNRLCFEILLRRFLDDKRIQIFNLAVSNYSGSSKLYLHEKSEGINDFQFIESSSLNYLKDNVSQEKNIKIKVEHISNILSKFSFIDLIKIDIEGSEYDIIPFLIDQKHKIKNVLCELHGNPKSNKNKEMTNHYTKITKELKELNLYNNWFYEWH